MAIMNFNVLHLRIEVTFACWPKPWFYQLFKIWKASFCFNFQ